MLWVRAVSQWRAKNSPVRRKMRELHANLPSLDLIPDANQKMAMFEANRFTEVEDLVTRQSGWIKKMGGIL